MKRSAEPSCLVGFFFSLTIFLVLTCGATLRAQSTAILKGTVTDPSGAVVPKAKVSVRNEGTGVQLETQTDEAGEYLVAGLSVGAYRVEASAPGFQTTVITGLRLKITANLGAYHQLLTPVIPTLTVLMAPGCYRIPNVDAECVGVFDQPFAVALQVAHVLREWERTRLALAPMEDGHVMPHLYEAPDCRWTDEPRSAENHNPHRAVAGATICGFFSTIRSTSPHSFACSGVMKKSRSIARSTSSSCRLQCFA